MMRWSVALVVLTSTVFAAPAKAPTLDGIKQHLREPKAADQLRVVVVDETCFPEMPPVSQRNISIEASREGGKITEQNATTTGLDGFDKFQAWAATRAKKGRTIGIGLSVMADKVYGYKAWCLAADVLKGKEAGLARSDKGAGVIWDGAALARVRKLDAAVRRVAVVYGASEVVGFVRLEDVRNEDKEVRFGFIEF